MRLGSPMFHISDIDSKQILSLVGYFRPSPLHVYIKPTICLDAACRTLDGGWDLTAFKQVRINNRRLQFAPSIIPVQAASPRPAITSDQINFQ